MRMATFIFMDFPQKLCQIFARLYRGLYTNNLKSIVDWNKIKLSILKYGSHDNQFLIFLPRAINILKLAGSDLYFSRARRLINWNLLILQRINFQLFAVHE